MILNCAKGANMKLLRIVQLLMMGLAILLLSTIEQVNVSALSLMLVVSVDGLMIGLIHNLVMKRMMR